MAAVVANLKLRFHRINDLRQNSARSPDRSCFLYRFAWDPEKAAANRGKHGVTFEQAGTAR